jgi:putative SOS response-associated peptidase YedK
MADRARKLPVILPPESYEAWLSGKAGTEVFPPKLMKACPVSTRVNTPKNDDAAKVQPLTATVLGLTPSFRRR